MMFLGVHLSKNTIVSEIEHLRIRPSEESLKITTVTNKQMHSSLFNSNVLQNNEKICFLQNNEKI